MSPIEGADPAGTRMVSLADLQREAGTTAVARVEELEPIEGHAGHDDPVYAVPRRPVEAGQKIDVRGYDVLHDPTQDPMVADELARVKGKFSKVIPQDEIGPKIAGEDEAQHVKRGGGARLEKVKKEMENAIEKAFLDFVTPYLSGRVNVKDEITRKMMIEGQGFTIDLQALGIGGRESKETTVMQHQQGSFDDRGKFLDDLCNYAKRFACHLMTESDIANIQGVIEKRDSGEITPADVDFNAKIDGPTMKIFFAYPKARGEHEESLLEKAIPTTPPSAVTPGAE